jgi:hypothetical protein
MDQPSALRQWWIGAGVGAMVGAAAYFLGCRWVQQALTEATANNAPGQPAPSDDALLLYALGVAAFGAVVGVIAGTRTTVLRAAGAGAALGLVPAGGFMVLVGGGTPQPWVVAPMACFLAALVASGAAAGLAGALVGGRRAMA